MTPQRWRQVNDLFGAAVGIEPAGREPWLRQACGGDDGLRAEVVRLLDGDERAAREGFLRPPEISGRNLDPPTPAPPPRAMGAAETTEAIDLVGDGSPGQSRGHRFTPRVTLAARGGSSLTAEINSLVRRRLRALAIIYVIIFGSLPVWRILVRRENDPTITTFNSAVVVSLGIIVVHLSGRRPLSMARLASLERGMVGLIAFLVATIYYRTMLRYALRGELTSMQIQMEHCVLKSSSSINITSGGGSAPAGWARSISPSTGS